MRLRRTGRWNHNVVYDRVVLDVIPTDATRALDVGCGEGSLARRLAAIVPRVVGVDADAASIIRARRAAPSGALEFRVADFLEEDLEIAFDVVSCVATLHHLPTLVGVRRLRALTRPGGVLVVVGCAQSRYPADLGWEISAVVAHWIRSIWSPYWDHGAPTKDPSETYAEIRAVLERELPGVRFRRRLFWRYTAVWERPEEARF